MCTPCRLACILVFSFISAHAADLPQTFHSKVEIRNHLFDGSNFDQPAAFQIETDNEAMSGGRKGVALAAIYSMLLPGMGELYVGNYSSGKYFSIAEGVLWLTYATFEVYGNTLQDDARAYARVNAGVVPTGKDDQYYIDIGNYRSLQDYNEAQLRSRNSDKLYDATAGYDWNWNSDGSRLLYRDQRIAADNMFNNRRFVVGVILINHIASAINAARSAVAHNNALDEQLGSLHLKADVIGGIASPHGILLTLTKDL